MGGSNSTTFTIGLKKVGAIAEFNTFDGSSPAGISHIESTSTTAKFFWNITRINWNKASPPVMNCPDRTRENEFSKIKSNYYVKVTTINSEFMELGLYASNSKISYLSWVNMLSTVNTGMFIIIPMSIDDTGQSIQKVEPTDFRYISLVSPSDIENNGAYLAQDGTTTYFDNTTVDVPVIAGEYNNLTNANGKFMITVNIRQYGVISMNNTYMKEAIEVIRIGESSVLIRLSVPTTNFTGNLMSNVNSNSNPVRNNGLVVYFTPDGIVCDDIMNGMNFTVLANITNGR
jgi:hypothetical protein